MQKNKLAARVTLAVVGLLATVGVLAQTAPEMRNTLAVTADLAREDSRPEAGGNGQLRSVLVDFEYARSLWSTLELTFAGSVRGVRLADSSATTTQGFRAYQIGARQYLFDPRRQAWTPYLDASLGEGWLTRKSTTGGETTQRFYGVELSAGLALHVSTRADLRLGAHYDRYLAYDQSASGRDTFSRLGLRLGAAVRF